MNREKSVKYCASDGEELSLEAGEVCDVEERRAAVGNTKCLLGATQIFRVIQPEGEGGGEGRSRSWERRLGSECWTEEVTDQRCCTHLILCLHPGGFATLRRRATPSMHDVHGFKQPSWPIRGRSYRCIIHYCVKTRAVFNDLLTTVINSVCWEGGYGQTDARHKTCMIRAASGHARGH